MRIKMRAMGRGKKTGNFVNDTIIRRNANEIDHDATDGELID